MLFRSIEIVVFPRDYEQNASLMEVDSKVFISGRVSMEEDKPSKLICERISRFEDVTRRLWVQFADHEEYEKEIEGLYNVLKDSDGKDNVAIYIRSEKKIIKLPPSRNVKIDEELLAKLNEKYGMDNVKIV